MTIAADMQPDPAELQEILRIFADSEMRELYIEVGDVRLQVSKDGLSGDSMVALPARAPAGDRAREPGPDDPAAAATPAQTSHPPATPALPDPTSGGAPSDPEAQGLTAVRSPVVGVFYRRPGPDRPPYVEVGQKVTDGSPVGTVEVMKMFTEVTAGCAGEVVEILAENEDFVEHGQVLMYVKRDTEPA